MAKIKQLPAAEAQKIAAGEVVERPANIVKELIENSLDAGADQIEIYLEEAGKKLIRIIDNGCGMSQDDAYMSIKHHATSKISKVDDLATIKTFGFRGEALSSISSISKFTLTTKEHSSITGITLEIIDNIVKNKNITSSNTGTEITISDIFYNVPARKKFLKSKETEWRAIVQLFYAFCMDYPNISFKLYNENRLIYNCPRTTDISKRLAQIYDIDLTKNLLLLDSQYEKFNLKLTGAISNPQISRYDRQQIFLFVNQRWVKNYKLSQALIKGYQNILAKEKYPSAFLFLTLDTECVDINIHPRKEEVQFLNPKIIEDFIYQSIKETLEKYLEKNLGAIKPVQNLTFNPEVKSSINQLDSISAGQQKIYVHPNIESIKQENKFLEILNQNFPVPKTELVEQTKVLTEDSLEYKLIGQVLQTYIIIQNQSGLVFIDQHAAHERILYEQFKQNFNDIAKVQLLFPQIIKLNSSDIKLIENYLSILSEFGLTIEIIGPLEIVIKETPVFLKNQNFDEIIKQFMGWILEFAQINKDQISIKLREKVHAQMSCKAAIKAGDNLTQESLHELIKNLYKTENKLTCPHGRPTIWSLDQKDIEKKFKRDYR